MNDLFTTNKRESAVDIVINNIKQLLIDRRLLPGDRLPNELEIAEGLGVSRGSVREAMKILSAFDLVDIKVGNGTYVCEAPGNKLIDSLLFTFFITNPDMDSLYEFRRVFEVDILELVLKHYDENMEERAALEKNLVQLQYLIDNKASSDRILENDIEFHRLLGNACHNPMANKIYGFIMDSIRASISNTHKHQKGEYVLKAHQDIYQIITAKAYDRIDECIKSSADIWYGLQK